MSNSPIAYIPAGLPRGTTDNSSLRWNEAQAVWQENPNVILNNGGEIYATNLNLSDWRLGLNGASLAFQFSNGVGFDEAGRITATFDLEMVGNAGGGFTP